MKDKSLDELSELLGYQFKDSSLLTQALTHRSTGRAHNEAMEFLGDTVLNTITSHYLYSTNPDATEGELTQLRSGIVNNKTALCSIAENIGFAEYIFIGKSFPKSNHQSWYKLLSDVLEAVIGAIYLDGGMPAAIEFFYKHFNPFIEDLRLRAHVNYKSKLQELTQRISHCVPEYKTVDIQGKDHAPQFTVSCYVSGLPAPILGTSRTVKEAEQAAAAKAYEQLRQQLDQQQ